MFVHNTGKESMRKSADDHFNPNMQEMQTFSWIIDETWGKKGEELNGYDHLKEKILKVLFFVASQYCLTIVSKTSSVRNQSWSLQRLWH